jgi:hypothetical protein
VLVLITLFVYLVLPLLSECTLWQQVNVSTGCNWIQGLKVQVLRPETRGFRILFVLPLPASRIPEPLLRNVASGYAECGLLRLPAYYAYLEAKCLKRQTNKHKHVANHGKSLNFARGPDICQISLHQAANQGAPLSRRACYCFSSCQRSSRRVKDNENWKEHKRISPLREQCNSNSSTFCLRNHHGVLHTVRRRAFAPD